MDKFRKSAMKGALIGAVGGVMSVLVLGGGRPVRIVSMMAPKFLVDGSILVVSSIASDYIIPYATPYLSAGSPALQKFNGLLLQPLMVGAVSTAVESFLAPGAVEGGGNVFRAMLVGTGSAVGAAYVADGMNWMEI